MMDTAFQQENKCGMKEKNCILKTYDDAMKMKKMLYMGYGKAVQADRLAITCLY